MSDFGTIKLQTYVIREKATRTVKKSVTLEGQTYVIQKATKSVKKSATLEKMSTPGAPRSTVDWP